jgi:16S rRNA G966 N2-methylase RsmD
MSRRASIPFHPAADIFPLMQGEEFAALVEDMRAHGQREPIVLHEGQILDGRNRYRACEALGIDPACVEWPGEGSPVAFVVSLNLHRRHLTESQRAMVGARIKPMFEAEARERQGARTDLRANLRESVQPAKASERAAEAVNVSPRSVESASRVLEQGAADLIAAVNAGEASVSAAAEIATLPVDTQREVVAVGPDEIVREANRIKRERKAQRRAERAARKRPTALPLDGDEACRLIVASVSDLPAHLSEPVDCIITDPPYPREYLDCYSDLSRTASLVLKDGGSCFVMVGQSYLPEILGRLAECLTYQWTLCYLTPGGQAAQLWDRRVNTFWKPVLWFVKGRHSGDWLGDVISSETNDNDKRFHDWGQSVSGMSDLVYRATDAGQTVLDPFCGGGATAHAALALGRRVIASDIDPASIEITRGRVAEVRHAAMVE